jgi:asparagine synthase (glutamine-hydrolysing)
MPGIVGCITRMPRERAQQELMQMIQTLNHEEFYVTGTWIDESLGVYVGWVTRQEDSFSSDMPIQNERGDLVLAFSGEEFRAAGTAAGFKQGGSEYNPDDASYLLHLYEADPAFLTGLNGRFHGLLIDRNLRTAMLFNDRYGMNRVYYHEAKESFYFAAEAKAILAVRPELRKLDPCALGQFVACGCTLEDRSLFEGIQILPTAARWEFHNGSLRKMGRYFAPREWEDQDPLEPEAYYQKLREVFSGNLSRYFERRNPTGMSLTGGLDTRMIMAWQRCQPQSLPCYSFGGMVGECQDVIIARQVARACEQSYQVIVIGTEFLSRFAEYAERAVYLSDGCADVSRAPDIYINRRAREIAPVRVTGLFGGEVLRRVIAFKARAPRRGLFAPEIYSQSQKAMRTYADLLRYNPVSFAVFKQAPWHHYGGLALEESQISIRTPYLDNDLVQTVFRAPHSTLAGNDVSLRLIGDGNQSLLQIPTDRGLAGQYGGFQAAVSRWMLEFLFKAEYAYDLGMPQWVARLDHALSRLRIERLFLGRHKIIHFRSWYRDRLAAYVRGMLLDPRTLSRPFFRRTGIEAMVHGHLKGDRNYTAEIHKVLTLELLHRLFLDRGSFSKSDKNVGEAGFVNGMANRRECVHPPLPPGEVYS